MVFEFMHVCLCLPVLASFQGLCCYQTPPNHWSNLSLVLLVPSSYQPCGCSMHSKGGAAALRRRRSFEEQPYGYANRPHMMNNYGGTMPYQTPYGYSGDGDISKSVRKGSKGFSLSNLALLVWAHFVMFHVKLIFQLYTEHVPMLVIVML